MPINLACVVGARPNFMKMAPLLKAIEAHPVLAPVLIHTGQHYDAALSDVFFEELGMRRPDVTLEVGSGKQGAQTARILERMEETLENGPPGGGQYDRVVVVGDVNSTMAATLAAAKLQIPVAHVEAGLRSFDRTMPEEINRIVTDAIADTLYVSDPDGVENLRREGHPEEQIQFVGNVMIDTLRTMLPRARETDTLQRHGLAAREYGVITLHRPANVDAPETLRALLEVLADVSRTVRLVFPVHPRTASRIDAFGLRPLLENAPRILLLPPQGYVDFLALTSQAKVVVTDSGGLQEESTVLGIPCLTMRDTTERPVTVSVGTSTLIGSDPVLLSRHLREVIDGHYKTGAIPEYWDGNASQRIAAHLARTAGGA